MYADSPQQNLLEFRTDALCPVVSLQLLDEPLLGVATEQMLPLQLLGHVPTLVPVEAEYQCRRSAGLVVAL